MVGRAVEFLGTGSDDGGPVSLYEWDFRVLGYRDTPLQAYSILVFRVYIHGDVGIPYSENAPTNEA